MPIQPRLAHVIRTADLICYPVGSFFSSVMANLLPLGVSCAVREAACQDSVKAVLDVELNEGQMLEDVKLAINGAKPIDFTGHCGSQMPTTDEIVEKILSMKEGK